MARESIIEKYGLQRAANDLLAPKPGEGQMTLVRICDVLTEKARRKAREENPDLAPSLLADIRITQQSLIRYRDRSGKAAQRIIQRNDQLATEAAEAQINGLGTLLRVRKELWTLYEAKKAAVGQDPKTGQPQLGNMDSLDAQRLLGRLVVVGKELLDLELMGMDPAIFTKFLNVLDKGVAVLFGQEAPEKLKEWLQDQDEFRDVAIALGWVSEDDEGAPPEAPGGGTVM